MKPAGPGATRALDTHTTHTSVSPSVAESADFSSATVEPDIGHGLEPEQHVVAIDAADPYAAVVAIDVAGADAADPTPITVTLHPAPGAHDSGAFAVQSSAGALDGLGASSVTSPGGTVSLLHHAQVLQVPRSPVPPAGKPSTRQLFAPTQRRGSDQRSALPIGTVVGSRRPSALARGGVVGQEENVSGGCPAPARRRSTIKPTLPPGAIPLPPPVPCGTPSSTPSALTPSHVDSHATSCTPVGTPSGRRASTALGAGAVAGRMSRRRSTAASRAMLPARPLVGVPHDYPATPTGCMDAYWDVLGRQRPPGAGGDVFTALHRHRSTDTQFLTLLVGAIAARPR